jgi:hypothetical protein
MSDTLSESSDQGHSVGRDGPASHAAGTGEIAPAGSDFDGNRDGENAMDRRDFVNWMAAAAGGTPALGLAAATPQSDFPVAAAGAAVEPESRAALQELLTLLQQIDARWLGPERRITRAEDIADGHRTILHLLSGGLDLVCEADTDRPVFRRMLSPSRSFQGDNPDALYYSAYVRPDRNYRIRGSIAGAVYTNISFELGSADGHYPTGVARAISDRDLPIAKDGSYEIFIGPQAREARGFSMDPGVGSMTTRHYFELKRCVAADRHKVIPLSIECIDPIGPRPSPSQASVAQSIRRLANWMRGLTLDQATILGTGKIPDWVSTVPNHFNPPALPGESVGFANRDAHYAMAPYLLKPDEALVIDGRFPRCRFANVALWNRFLQSYDYDTRQVSLNRRQTTQATDGSFRMIVAHSDPGLPNWLDTEGRASGLVYWRFVFPEDAIQPLATRVVPFKSLTTI